MAENLNQNEEIKDLPQEELSQEELRERRKNLVNMFKQQTVFLKAQAEYEETMTRIAVAQRDRAIAEYDLARIMAEQKRAEEEYKKKNSEPKEKSKEDEKEK